MQAETNESFTTHYCTTVLKKSKDFFEKNLTISQICARITDENAVNRSAEPMPPCPERIRRGLEADLRGSGTPFAGERSE